MKRAFILSLVATLGAVCVPVQAQEEAANEGAARPGVKPVRLVSFDGEREFLKSASRLRVWRSEVEYTLEVDSSGTPTDCQLAEEFRMNYVNDKLCEVLMKHHTFEPAQDASGAPVEGSYEGRLNFLEIRQKD